MVGRRGNSLKAGSWRCNTSGFFSACAERFTFSGSMRVLLGGLLIFGTSHVGPPLRKGNIKHSLPAEMPRSIRAFPAAQPMVKHSVLANRGVSPTSENEEKDPKAPKDSEDEVRPSLSSGWHRFSRVCPMKASISSPWPMVSHPGLARATTFPKKNEEGQCQRPFDAVDLSRIRWFWEESFLSSCGPMSAVRIGPNS